ncbi:MAG: hypothetical protein JNK08_06385 [Sediminibacterium sp.]|nr:hypothetical protein [Sediminibacterium sp.]
MKKQKDGQPEKMLHKRDPDSVFKLGKSGKNKPVSVLLSIKKAELYSMQLWKNIISRPS